MLNFLHCTFSLSGLGHCPVLVMLMIWVFVFKSLSQFSQSGLCVSLGSDFVSSFYLHAGHGSGMNLDH